MTDPHDHKQGSVPGPSRRPCRVSFEFFPPKTPEMEEKLWRAIERLEPLHPTFVSVTYGAGGSTRERTHATVKRILEETQLTPAAHLTCVSATRGEIDAVVQSYWDVGVRHIVALRGDPAGGLGERFVPHPGGYATSADLVRGIKKRGPFEVSVGCYPEVHPEAASAEADLDVLKGKIDAGADRAISQFFFEPDVFLRFRDRVRSAGIEIPVVPGIMPIANFKNARNFAKKAGASVPPWLDDLFGNLDADPDTRLLVAATCAAQLCLNLLESGVDQFHFYTLNRPELVRAICHMLGIKPQSETDPEQTGTSRP